MLQEGSDGDFRQSDHVGIHDRTAMILFGNLRRAQLAVFAEGEQVDSV